jgi:hypothetical protein
VMRKEQLDPLSLAARDGVGLGLGDRTDLVTSGFMNGARDFACRNVRAALGLERAGLAVALAHEVDQRVVFVSPSRGLEKARRYFLSSLQPGQT